MRSAGHRILLTKIQRRECDLQKRENQKLIKDILIKKHTNLFVIFWGISSSRLGDSVPNHETIVAKLATIWSHIINITIYLEENGIKVLAILKYEVCSYRLTVSFLLLLCHDRALGQGFKDGPGVRASRVGLKL